MSQRCRRCAGTFPLSCCVPGKNLCKPCNREEVANWRAVNREYHSEYHRQKRARRKEAHALSHEYDDVMSEHEGESETFLYIMRYEFDPCGTMGVNIGRTKNLAARVAQKESGHNFRMKVLRVYRGLGNLEPLVHELLASRRASGGAGTEWFDVSVSAAMTAGARARALGRGEDLQEAASALSESLDDEDSSPPVGQCEAL